MYSRPGPFGFRAPASRGCLEPVLHAFQAMVSSVIHIYDKARITWFQKRGRKGSLDYPWAVSIIYLSTVFCILPIGAWWVSSRSSPSPWSIQEGRKGHQLHHNKKGCCPLILMCNICKKKIGLPYSSIFRVVIKIKYTYIYIYTGSTTGTLSKIQWHLHHFLTLFPSPSKELSPPMPPVCQLQLCKQIVDPCAIFAGHALHDTCPRMMMSQDISGSSFRLSNTVKKCQISLTLTLERKL